MELRYSGVGIGEAHLGVFALPHLVEGKQLDGLGPQPMEKGPECLHIRRRIVEPRDHRDPQHHRDGLRKGIGDVFQDLLVIYPGVGLVFGGVVMLQVYVGGIQQGEYLLKGGKGNAGGGLHAYVYPPLP